jgi:hypothetical protein
LWDHMNILLQSMEVTRYSKTIGRFDWYIIPQERRRGCLGKQEVYSK